MGNLEEHFHQNPISSTSAGALAEAVYGKGKLSGLLKRKHKRFIERRHTIPRILELGGLPSYKEEDWKKKIPVHKSKHPLNIRGIFFNEEERIGIGKTILNTPLERSVKEHETIHFLQKQRNKDSSRFRDFPEPPTFAGRLHKKFVGRPEIRGPNFSSWLNRQEEMTRIGASESTRVREIAPRTTEAVREFYRTHGREVQNERDVKEGIRLLKEQVRQYPERERKAEKGALEGLEQLPYIGELGQMLVMRSNKRNKRA